MVLQLKIINCKNRKKYFIIILLIIYLYRFLMDNISETGETHIIKEYNLETRKWESSHDMKQSTDNRRNEKNQLIIKNEESKSYENRKN